MKRISNRILTFGTITAFAVSPVFVVCLLWQKVKSQKVNN